MSRAFDKNALTMELLLEVKQTLKNLEKLKKQTKSVTDQTKKAGEAAKKAAARTKAWGRSTRKAGRNIRLATGHMRAFIAALTGIGALAGVFFILGKGVRAMVENTINGVKASAKLDAVLKTTAFSAGFTKMQLDEMSLALSQVTTFAQTEITEAQGIMATFTKIGKETFPRATEAAMDLSTVFGQTLQQSSIQLGMALQDPIGAVGRLKRVGVDFNEEQKKMIREFAEMNDVAAAQDIILKGVEGQVGGTAKAIGTTLIGSIERLVNAWALMFEQIGTLITEIPQLTVEVDNMNDSINNWINLPLEEKMDSIARAMIDAVSNFTLFWITVGPVLDALVAWFLRKPLMIALAIDRLGDAFYQLGLNIELAKLEFLALVRDLKPGFLRGLALLPGMGQQAPALRAMADAAETLGDLDLEGIDIRRESIRADLKVVEEEWGGTMEEQVEKLTGKIDGMLDAIGLGFLDPEVATKWQEDINNYIIENIIDPWKQNIIERNRRDAEEKEKIRKRQEAIDKLVGSWLDKMSQFTHKLEKAGVDLQQLGRAMGSAIAETRSMREVVGQAIANTLATEAEEMITGLMADMIKKQFGEAGEQSGLGEGITALLGGIVGGFVGSAVMKLFRKKPKPVTKPIPVKVVNWGDMTQQLLKASARRAVGPMITTGSNSMMSSNFGREARI